MKFLSLYKIIRKSFFKTVSSVYILKKLTASIFIFSFIFSPFVSLFPTNIAEASFSQNNSTGTWDVNFNNNQQGIAPDGAPLRENITIDPTAGIAKLTPTFSSGYFNTVAVSPSSFTLWDKVIVDATYSTSTDVRISLYTCSNVPIVGFQNMTLGAGGVIDISSLPISNTCVKARADLTDSGGARPIINDIKITWVPLPVLLITHSANTTRPVADGVVYAINYSVSFVDDTGVVVWAPLPRVSDGTVTDFNPAYGITPDPTFVQASNGGLYTATPITVAGINVPGNSVYWNLGSIAAGFSGTLSYELATQNNWQNGITYHSQVYIDSVAANQVISDSDGLTVGAQKFVTTLTSAPAPTIEKKVNGVVKIDDDNYVVNAGAYTKTATYSIKIKNTRASSGRETIWNPVITDNLSDIYSKLSAVCGVAIPSSRVIPNNGGALVGNTIVWDVPTGDLTNLISNQEKTVTYTVDYTGCPDDAVRTYDNTATLSADNISDISDNERVYVGMNSAPGGIFIKRGPENKNHNDTYDYTLTTRNPGTVALGDVVMADKIDPLLTLTSVAVPAAAGATVYYNTTGAANPVNTPPTYTVNPGVGISGAGWTTVKPASGINWVLVYTPCLDSPLFPSPAGNTLCHQKPTSVTATVTVTLLPPAAACSAYTVPNTGVLGITRSAPDFNNTSLSATTNISATYPVTTTVSPRLASFTGESDLTGPNSAQVTDNVTYTVTIENTGQDTALGTVVNFTLPRATINGIPNVPFSFVSASGGSVTTTGLPNTVSVTVGNIPQGSTRTVTITLNPPKGIPALTVATLQATVTASDDNNCRTISTTLSKSITVTSEPQVLVTKSRKEALIPSGDDIHYTINWRSVGNAPTTNTYVVDFIPTNAVFKRAYTTGTDAAGTTFNCPNCKVYFSNSLPSLPPGATPFDALTTDDIVNAFSLGTQISPGVWTSPFGSTTHWVAWLLDDPTLTPNLLPTGRTGTVGLTVTNDLDGVGPGTVGSPVSDVITNEAAVFTTELLQAIGNQVQTTIAPAPGLALSKTADVSVVSGNETFNWNVAFFNDGSGSSSGVTLVDTMNPLGGTLNGVYLTWNTVAIGNGAPAGEVNITSNPNLTLVNNLDGTITATFDVTGYRGGALNVLEGATIRFNITTDSSVTTGMNLTNNVVATYTTGTGSETNSVEHSVPVANPDLWIRKNVSDTNPLPGQTLQYTLTISNEGGHSANGITIVDSLPLGICFTPGTASIPSPVGYSIGAPVVTGDCTTTPQTLTWNNSPTGPLGAGILGADSPDVMIVYQASVNVSVPSGTNLTNGATISTPLTEDAVYTNASNQTVTTPFPDAYVTKSGPVTTSPGSLVTYTITYGNDSKQSVTNVYMIDTLPDQDADGTADFQFVSVTGTSGESFYYHAAPVAAVPPVFDPVSPLSGGWTAAPGPVVSYIAIRKPTLANLEGPNTVQVKVNAVDPDTGLPSATGLTFVNTVTITATNDQNTANNVASATTRTPGFDLSISKTSPLAGSFPGITPGTPITYTVTFKNQGTGNACDIHMSDTLSSGLSFADSGSNFTLLELTDENGNPIAARDTTGNPITSTIPVSGTISGQTITFDLGTTVCMPPDTQMSFEVYARADSSLLDGATVSNTATITTTGPSVEQVLTNNTASVSSSVWRADVTATKTGAVTPGGSTTLANPGETVEYTITYNNIGNYDAANTILVDKIPSEVCFITGSLTAPVGAHVEYSNDNASTWTYTPTGTDCTVTHFRVVWDSPLPAPATFDSEATLAEFSNTGHSNTQEQTLMGTTTEAVTLAAQNNFEAKYSDFAPQSTTTNALYGAVVGDFDNDGKFDIVRSLQGNILRFYKNTDNTWNTVPTVDTTLPVAGFQWLRVGDFNEDGKYDLIGSINTGTPSVYIGIGNGSGGFAFSAISGVTGQKIQVADFNNDGFDDLLVASSSTIRRLLIGNGTGNFPTSITIPNSSPATHPGDAEGIFAADFNNDGYLDFSISGRGAAPSFIYLNDLVNTNNFIPTYNSGTSVSIYGQTFPYDFNGDGAADYIRDLTGSTTTSGIYINNGTGTNFVKATPTGYAPYSTGSNFVSYGFADFNNDGHVDIFRPSNSGVSYGTIFYGNASNNSATIAMPNLTYTISSVAHTNVTGGISGTKGFVHTTADITGDGKIDIVYNHNPLVLINTHNEYKNSGTYTTSISSGPTNIGWGKLLLNHTLPTGTSATYEIRNAACTTVLLAAQAAPLGYLDISSIPSANTTLCLKVNMATTNPDVSPILDGWRATYLSSVQPSFTYQAQVKATPQLGIIPNSIQISTTTPEINTGNNDSTKEHQLVVADVSLVKTVDKSAALVGDNLVYTLTYKNEGPSTANQVTLTDTLPALVGAPSGIIISGVTGTTPVCSFAASVIYCDEDGNSGTASTLSLNNNDTGIITITVPILGTAVNGDILTNTATITTATYQITTANDTGTVNTVIGTYPNVYIQKTGPTKANVDKDIVYTITYGNNGNTVAPDVTITDTFDPNVTFISAVSTDGTMPACVPAGSTVTCGGAGYTLPVGASHTLTVTLHVNNDFNLLINSEIIDNDVTITTSVPESSISDNAATYDIPVYPFGFSSISGTVFIDTNGNVIKDLGETGLAGVIINLTGTDIYGMVIALSTTTNASGEYTFSGLKPGTYTITQTQPAGYNSTGASAGTNLLSGNGAVSGVNMISTITVSEAQNSLDNNFGEASGTIGNQVFYDQNANSTFDVGDIGLAGVRILLVTDTNNNGVQDVGESVRVTYTDAAGNYQFTNLPFGNYITKVSDTAGVLSSYTAVAGANTGGSDNDAKNVAGYTIILSGMTPSVQTADFGYTLTPFVPATPGTIGTKVFSDFNGNGILDGADVGIPQVSVDLYRDNDSSGTVTFGDTFLGRLFTDSNGDYLFGGLTLDRRYVVRVSDTLGNLAGYINTLGTPNTDNNGQNSLGYPVHLQTGINEYTITGDFSYQPPYPDLRILKSHLGLNVQGGTATYNIVVSNKTTASGNATSPIRVTDTLVSDLTYVSATGTDWDCSATVAPLVDCTYIGTYPVTPGTTLPTLTITATISATAVPPLTNTASVSTPLELSHVLADNTASDPVTYVAASADGVIGTTVWVDEDGDGQRDLTEPGISGVTIRLYRDWDGDGLPDDLNADLAIDINDEIKPAQVTDGSGEYLFTGLDRDDLINGYYDYLVSVDTTTIPVGHTHTTGTANTDNFSQVETNYAIRLSNTDPANVTADFGYQPPSPDLTITKTHSGIVHQGDTVTFTMSVANTVGFGDVPTTNEIIVTDTMPVGMTLIPSATVTATSAISAAWNCSTSTATLLRCISNAGLVNGNTLPNIAAVIEVNPVSVPTTITNTATVSTVRETVANTANNTAHDSVDVVLTNTGAIGSIVWDDQNGNGHRDVGESGIGGVRIYLYRDVNEDGVIDAGDTLLDTQITSTTLGTIGEYQFVNLERDLGLGYYPYIVRVETADVTAINTLYVQSIGAPGVDDESQVQDYQVTLNSTTASNQTADFGFKLPPELTLTKTISGSSVVHVGQSMTFLIEVANIGGGTTNGSDIIITDTLPANLTFSTIGSSPECSAVGQMVTCTLTGIPAVLAAYTGNYSFTIVSVANAVGSISNSADVTGGGISGSVASLPSSGTINPTAWTITKTGTPLTGISGTPTTFTITITNSGGGNTVGSYSVTDTLAAGLVFNTADSDTRCAAVGQVVTCADTAVLAPGASTSFDIKVDIASAGSYENTATVSGGSAISATSNTVTVVRTAPPASGGGGGGGSPIFVPTVYVCKDITASNYSSNSSAVHNQALCIYPQKIEQQKPVEENKPLTCTTTIYLTKPVKLGENNNPNDVKLLEQFLNQYEGNTLAINGIYEQIDFDAVVRWQEKYADLVLKPWGVSKGTGYVYTTSLAQIKRQVSKECIVEKEIKPEVKPEIKPEIKPVFCGSTSTKSDIDRLCIMPKTGIVTPKVQVVYKAQTLWKDISINDEELNLALSELYLQGIIPKTSQYFKPTDAITPADMTSWVQKLYPTTTPVFITNIATDDFYQTLSTASGINIPSGEKAVTVLKNKNIIPTVSGTVLSRSDFVKILFRLSVVVDNKEEKYIPTYTLSIPQADIVNLPAQRTLLSRSDVWLKALTNGAGFYEDPVHNKTVIFAHSSKWSYDPNIYGKVFAPLDQKLKVGDTITLNTTTGIHTYRVYTRERIHESNVSSIKDYTTYDLFLFTCDHDISYRLVWKLEEVK